MNVYHINHYKIRWKCWYIMNLNIPKYMAFIKTIEYGSFTKAAEILNYSQSGISRMIHDLEKE